MEREVEGGIRMGNTCKLMAVSFQCMTKSTTIKKKNKDKHVETPQAAQIGETVRSSQERGFGGTGLSPSSFLCHEPWASLLDFQIPNFSRCDLAPKILLLTSGSEDGRHIPTPKCVSNDANSCMTLGRSCVFTVSGQSLLEPGQEPDASSF